MNHNNNSQSRRANTDINERTARKTTGQPVTELVPHLKQTIRDWPNDFRLSAVSKANHAVPPAADLVQSQTTLTITRPRVELRSCEC